MQNRWVLVKIQVKQHRSDKRVWIPYIEKQSNAFVPQIIKTSLANLSDNKHFKPIRRIKEKRRKSIWKAKRFLKREDKRFFFSFLNENRFEWEHSCSIYLRKWFNFLKSMWSPLNSHWSCESDTKPLSEGVMALSFVFRLRISNSLLDCVHGNKI